MQIRKPRTSSFIRLVLLPSGHTVHKVDTLSQFAIINSDLTTLWFAMPYAALSMNGSYAILMDRGAVVGQGCSYDGPPTPGITNTSDWHFTAGFCPVGYTLAPPDFSNCVGTYILVSFFQIAHYYLFKILYSFLVRSNSPANSPFAISGKMTSKVQIFARKRESSREALGKRLRKLSCSWRNLPKFHTFLEKPTLFFHTNPSNFRRLLKSLLLRYRAENLPNFNMLFQLVLAQVFKANCFRV